MKKIAITLLLTCSFLGAGCSPPDAEMAQATPGPTPAPRVLTEQEQKERAAAETRRAGKLGRSDAEAGPSDAVSSQLPPNPTASPSPSSPPP